MCIRDRLDVEVEAVDFLFLQEVNDYELLLLGVSDKGIAIGSLKDRSWLLPFLVFLPPGDGINLLGDFTGIWVDDVEFAVGGQHKCLAQRAAG